jgi:hypothetical protein
MPNDDGGHPDYLAFDLSEDRPLIAVCTHVGDSSEDGGSVAGITQLGEQL